MLWLGSNEGVVLPWPPWFYRGNTYCEPWGFVIKYQPMTLL